MKKAVLFAVFVAALLAASMAARARAEKTGWTLVGWNNLGMHCMDGDYSVFSLLPPYNTIHAQLVDPSGRLVADPSGITITYQGVADPSGSINTESAEKTNFWQFVAALFGASPQPDTGLAGVSMPGAGNVPQPMAWDAGSSWFVAEGIPITPYDDAGRKNTYPMMHLVARDAGGAVLAVTDIVLPVSDEMSCMMCHGSGGDELAEPRAGWVNDPNPERDFRLNILRLHDDRQIASPTYLNALATAGYDAAGLYRTAAGGKPVLCARCHASNALPGSGIAGIPALTGSIHSFHGHVVDDDSGEPLDSMAVRDACYRCHPGSTTKCLRGVMGNSVAADGSMAIQCQDCHGSMSAVGDPARAGWLDEPTCQMCHTGTASHNNGEIRYTSVFEPSGRVRVAVDHTFATNANTPAPGLSLYRFSSGHGGLKCEACHGSTHAEYPSNHDSDNIQGIQLQGHAGPLSECSACHGNQPLSHDGGPHGMHTLGQSWVDGHGHDLESRGEHESITSCQPCHGVDYRGTVLSRTHADRSFSTPYGTKGYWKGYQVGCYSCHDGPSSKEEAPGSPPVARDGTAEAFAGTPLPIYLVANSPAGRSLAYRIVSQPRHGSVGLEGASATFFPAGDFAGSDSFTFAAWDGYADSNLGTVAISDGQPPVISEITQALNPYRIKVSGSNLREGAAVYIGDDTGPWQKSVYKDQALLVLKGGSALRSKFPMGKAVDIRVVNPDGGSSTGIFTRR